MAVERTALARSTHRAIDRAKLAGSMESDDPFIKDSRELDKS
jgi:hypothetical protein